MNHAQRVALFRDRLEPGAKIRCVRNERIPERAGLVCVVGDKIGKYSFPVKRETGESYWLSLPTKAGDLVMADETHIAYRLEHGGEIVEWELIG